MQSQPAIPLACTYLNRVRESPGSVCFQVLSFSALAFGMVAGHDHLQHLPCLTMKTSFIPKAEGLFCTVLPVQSF